MDADWTSLSHTWLWEEEDEFKNDSIGSDWTKEVDKALSYDYGAIGENVLAINSSNVPLPHYQIIDGDKGKQKKTLRSKGKPWTEEEHRRFLLGLEEYGRGDWRRIAKFCVQTRSNSQVASHAQKYFQRMNSSSRTKNSKRHSIHDVSLDYPRINSITVTGEKQLTLSPTDFIDMSTLFSNHTIGDGSIFGSTSGSKSIQDSAGTVTYHPSFPLVHIYGVSHPLVEDSGIANPFSGGVHVLPKIQSDNNMHNPDLFDFSFMNEIDSMMQPTGMNMGSSGVPFLLEVQPLVYGERTPSYGLASLELSSTFDSQQPLMQVNGVQGSGIPSSSTEMVDLDIFTLPPLFRYID